MFKDTKAFSGFTTPEAGTVRDFYAETLGVEVSEENGMLTLELEGGKRPTLVYPKGDAHEPAGFTVLNFETDEIEKTVDALAERGVEFDTYEGMEFDDHGIMRSGGPPIAWFKDPAGNVLSVIETS